MMIMMMILMMSAVIRQYLRSIIYYFTSLFGVDKEKKEKCRCIETLSMHYSTALVIIKLTKFSVALRLRYGSCKLILFHHFLLNLRTLYII